MVGFMEEGGRLGIYGRTGEGPRTCSLWTMSRVVDLFNRAWAVVECGGWLDWPWWARPLARLRRDEDDANRSYV